jgi:two-component system, chemotaxis family, sensor kinase CheA
MVRVTNHPNQGSLFTVSLPLTLAILDGMIVRVGAETYIIPITSIIETLRPRGEEIRHVEGHSDVINVRGEFVSLIYLYRTFNIPHAQRDPSKALVVLVESGERKMGLVVDELIGQQQVVIKSLEANADPVRGISGATILGDGRVSLILEINDVGQMEHTPERVRVLEAA